MRLALIATIFVFAGSIAGFNLTSATGGGSGDAARAVQVDAKGGSEIVVRDCPAERLAEDAEEA